MIPEFKGEAMTFRDQLGPAMEVTDPEEAAEYYRKYVDWLVSANGKSREYNDGVARANLGYFAGYYDNETRERVEKLFQCAHPVFGAIATKGPPTPEEAFAKGVEAGTSAKAASEAR